MATAILVAMHMDARGRRQSGRGGDHILVLFIYPSNVPPPRKKRALHLYTTLNISPMMKSKLTKSKKCPQNCSSSEKYPTLSVLHGGLK